MQGLERVPGGLAASLFVRLSHSELSAYIWENEDGEVQTIHQGESGEQDDAFMPILFFFWPARNAFSFSWMILSWVQEKVGEAHSVLERELWVHKIPRRRCGRGQVSRFTGRASMSWDVHWVTRIS